MCSGINLFTTVQFLCGGFTGAPDGGTDSSYGTTGPAVRSTASNNIILLYLQEYFTSYYWNAQPTALKSYICITAYT